MKTVAYICTSTNTQETNNQKLETYEYARKNALKIDDVIEIHVSSKKDRLQRRIDELLRKLTSKNILIVTEISGLGRSTSEVIHIINELMQRKIRFIAIKQGLDLHNHDISSKIIVLYFLYCPH